MPALTLLSRSDEPAVLEGYGPIDVDTAKELVGKATSFIRILTHPETGAFLSVGRKRYKAPADLRMVLRLRDETCRHPGRNRAAGHTDIDHTIAFNENGAGGETRIDNLASVCPPNHRDKHETGWRVTRDPDGTLHWVSPTGHGYDTESAIRIGPASEAAPF
ncbi:HNH endonuclease signature motif containing protein [Glaciibacter sp. 2TAF33]|uniref:HNH endonuclease signature motif containing protein n=1 Tax=Glaciibacter sp. 2TAF33 TaxID=3233015 RepID=UPI003F8F22B4